MDKIYLNKVLTKQLKEAEFQKKKTCDSNTEKVIDEYIEILKKIEEKINQV